MKTKNINLVNRRRFLFSSLTVMSAAILPGFGLVSCTSTKPAIRIGSNIWPGYEFLFLARELKYLDENVVRMVELPSASVCLEALSAGTIEGACLTLDEVLTAQADGLKLKVVAVLDISMGADVLLAGSKNKTLQDLKGKKIGVEQSAVGAVMLHSALEKGGLKVSDIEIVHMNVNRHKEAYLKGQVDALVTFEPVVSQLAKTGSVKLFTSADIPGRIVDVIAVRPDVLETRPDAVKDLVAAHFKGLKKFQSDLNQVSPIMARRLKVKPEEVPQLYVDVELPDINANRKLLQGPLPELEKTALKLSEIMVSANLLPQNFNLTPIVDDRFLPQSQ